MDNTRESPASHRGGPVMAAERPIDHPADIIPSVWIPSVWTEIGVAPFSRENAPPTRLGTGALTQISAAGMIEA